jgi:hypothetical protein
VTIKSEPGLTIVVPDEESYGFQGADIPAVQTMRVRDQYYLDVIEARDGDGKVIGTFYLTEAEVRALAEGWGLL